MTALLPLVADEKNLRDPVSERFCEILARNYAPGAAALGPAAPGAYA